MRICIDIDGTICETDPNKYYDEVRPLPDAVKTIQKLRKQGHWIIICTARGMKTFNNNVGAITAGYGKLTMDWLDKHKIPYDELWFGKPLADIYIDDKAIEFKTWKQINDKILN